MGDWDEWWAGGEVIDARSSAVVPWAMVCRAWGAGRAVRSEGGQWQEASEET